MRLLVLKIEIAVGLLLAAASVVHVSWCSWSLPRHGTTTAHGLETSVCNWGTALLDIAVGIIAVLTIISGVIGYRVRSRTVPWYAAQVPAMVAWGWVAYAVICSVFVYPY